MNEHQLRLLGQLVASLDADPIAQADFGTKLTNQLFERYADALLEATTTTPSHQ